MGRLVYTEDILGGAKFQRRLSYPFFYNCFLLMWPANLIVVKLRVLIVVLHLEKAFWFWKILSIFRQWKRKKAMAAMLDLPLVFKWTIAVSGSVIALLINPLDKSP